MKRIFTFTLTIPVLCCAWLATSVAFSQEQPLNREIAFRVLDRELAHQVASGEGPLTEHRPEVYGMVPIGTVGGKIIDLELTTKRIIVKEGFKLEELLASNGIRADANAASLVYDLNPNLPTVHNIPDGTTVIVPIVTIEQRSPNKPVIALELDRTLKSELVQSIDTFTSTTKKRNKYDATVRNDLAAIDQSLAQIRDDRIPSSRETLTQIEAEVGALRTIFAKPAANLSLEDRDQVNRIKADLEVKIEASAGGNPNVLVTVKTLREEDGTEISHWRRWRQARQR